MCCDTMLCSAQSEGCRFAECASGIVSRCVGTTSQFGKPHGVAWIGGVDDVATNASSVGGYNRETGAAVRTAWASRPRRGAGFTSIQ
jgi:hypothetical protein